MKQIASKVTVFSDGQTLDFQVFFRPAFLKGSLSRLLEVELSRLHHGNLRVPPQSQPPKK